MTLPTVPSRRLASADCRSTDAKLDRLAKRDGLPQADGLRQADGIRADGLRQAVATPGAKPLAASNPGRLPHAEATQALCKATQALRKATQALHKAATRVSRTAATYSDAVGF